MGANVFKGQHGGSVTRGGVQTTKRIVRGGQITRGALHYKFFGFH